MSTKTWVRVADDIVVETIELDAELVPGIDIFPPDMAAHLFDVTAMNPKPVFGWRRVKDGFEPPET